MRSFLHFVARTEFCLRLNGMQKYIFHCLCLTILQDQSYLKIAFFRNFSNLYVFSVCGMVVEINVLKL